MLPKIRSNYNRNIPDHERFETPDPISMTIPDMSMSMAEIMNRYTRGIPFETGRIPIWDENQEFPDWEKMDISEQYELARANQERIIQLQQKHHDYVREKKKARQRQISQPAPSAGGTTPIVLDTPE